jgi:hypothetical protein
MLENIPRDKTWLVFDAGKKNSTLQIEMPGVVNTNYRVVQ